MTNVKRHDIQINTYTFTSCDSGTESQGYRLFYYRACLGKVTRHQSVRDDMFTITFDLALNTCDIFEKVQFFYKFNESITEQTGFRELVEWLNEKKSIDRVTKKIKTVPTWPDEVIGAVCLSGFRIVKKDADVGMVTYEIVDQEGRIVDQFTITYNSCNDYPEVVCYSKIGGERITESVVCNVLSCTNAVLIFANQLVDYRSTEQIHPDPDDIKMQETDQKDTGYNATGNCDSSLIITINDIMWLPDGDRQINISVKRSEQIYGYRRPEPIIKSMVLIESTSKSEYPFIVKQINSFTRLEGLDLPMKFRVGDTVSMMCVLNSVVTTTIKLIQEKYRTVFDLLES